MSSQKSEQSPIGSPRCPSDCCLHTVSGPPGCPGIAVFFGLYHKQSGFKTPNFWDLEWCRPALVLWGRVCLSWVLISFDPDDSITKAWETGFCSKEQQRANVWVNHPQQVSASMLRGGGGKWSPWLFCPKRGNATSPRCAPRRVIICPSVSQGIRRRHHLSPGYLSAFSTGALQCPQCSKPAKPWTSKTLVYEPPWL